MKKQSLYLIFISLLYLLTGCGGNVENGTSPATTMQAPPMAAAPAADTVTFPDVRKNYSISHSPPSISVTHKTSRVTTTHLNAKRIQFSDMSVNLMVAQNAKTIASKDLNSLIDLYIAFFNRVPDADGLNYWIDNFKAGATIDQIAANFYLVAKQNSAITGYDEKMDDEAFVRLIYKNVLGRVGSTAPPDSHVAYWVGDLQKGLSKEKLVAVMLVAAREYVDSKEWGWMTTLLNNKVAFGKYFALEQGLTYNTYEDSIRNTVALTAAVTQTDYSAAQNLLNIESAIQSIVISPSTATIGKGFSQQFTATANYSDGKSAIVTPVWTSSNTFAASINSSGLAKSEMSIGNTIIVATFNGVSSSANLSITDATINSIKLSTPYKDSYPIGVSERMSATATMSDGWTKDVTKTAVWTSSNSAVATVNAGVIMPLSVGTTNISAASGGVSVSYSFVVNSATPTSISIGGPDAGPDMYQPNNFAQGSLVELRLGVFFSDNSYFTSVGGSWSSSNTAKVSINNAGVFSANAPGNVIISANFRGVTATRDIAIATPLSAPLISLTCNIAAPMSISAAMWNTAYANDPSNLTKWLDVDWVSCNSRVAVKLVHVNSNYLLFEAKTATNNVFFPGKVFSSGRTPQLTAGDVIRVGYSDSLGLFYYTLYTITVKP